MPSVKTGTAIVSHKDTKGSDPVTYRPFLGAFASLNEISLSGAQFQFEKTASQFETIKGHRPRKRGSAPLSDGEQGKIALDTQLAKTHKYGIGTHENDCGDSG